MGGVDVSRDTEDWSVNLVSDYVNMPMQYAAIFHGCKIENFKMKKIDIFSYFCSKHRLWVHVRSLIEAVLMSTHNLCF